MELKINWTDVERVRLAGDFLNALAMVGGTAEVEPDASGRKSVTITSCYFIIPNIPNLEKQSPTAFMEDTLPAKLPASLELFEKLQNRQQWLARTVIALSIRDYLRAQSTGDRHGLEKVRAYLIKEKATQPEDSKVVPLLDSLLALVEKELTQ